MRTGAHWARRLLVAYAAAVFFFLMAPLVIVFPLSLSSATYLQFPPPGLSLQWFRRYVDSPDWMDATFLSVEVAAATMILALALGVPFAFYLTRGTSPALVRALDRLALSPLVIPTIITAIAIYNLFSGLHIIGTWYNLVLGHAVLALPYVVIVVAAALRGSDAALENAAMGLGANRFRAVLHVTLPQIRASLVSAAFFAFMASFDDLVLALFLSGSNMTLPRKTFENIMYAIDPTIAAVSVVQILFVILAGAAWWLLSRGRAMLPGV